MAKKEKIEVKVKQAPKKKIKQKVQKAIVRVKSGYNNTIVSITDLDGNLIAASSCGTVGFKGSKRSTAFAATKAAEDAAFKSKKYGVSEVTVIVKGMGMGRQAAVKGIRSGGLKITSLSDYTPIPHGGTVPRKQPKK